MMVAARIRFVGDDTIEIESLGLHSVRVAAAQVLAHHVLGGLVEVAGRAHALQHVRIADGIAH